MKAQLTNLGLPGAELPESSQKFHYFPGPLLRVFLAALVITVPGCKLTMPHVKSEEKLHAQKDIAVTPDQLRLRARALVGPMCGEIEQTADAIIASTTNRPVQRGALTWKIEGVPAMRQALFQPDPFTALMDSAVLCDQMADFFEKGPGKESLGKASAQAVAACRSMEQEITRVAASATISGDVSRSRAFARQWAADHPIRYSIAERESTLSRVFERGGAAGSFSTGEIAAEMAATVDDLNRRLEIYSSQLFRQARWEAEVFKEELFEGLPVDQVLPMAEQAVKSAEEASAAAHTAAETAPQVVAAIKAVQEELVRTRKFVQEESIAVLEQLTRERVAALKELSEDMADERKAMSLDIEQISMKTVDYAMWRMAQLVAVTVAVLLLSAIGGLFFIRRIFFRAASSSQHL